MTTDTQTRPPRRRIAAFPCEREAIVLLDGNKKPVALFVDDDSYELRPLRKRTLLPDGARAICLVETIENA